ncbi:Uncharacterised protein [Klebsiella pneumoniae]|nr:Uncharacterised protein [Klebsiella pneumoniae]
MNITINTPSVKTILDVQCDHCNFTGTIDYARTVISRIPSCLAVKCRTPEGI